MNPVTNGPKVNESMETFVPGIYACGNVLHVHDLVDYVSEEASNAGKYAARQCVEEVSAPLPTVSLQTGNGVRYTVPVIIRPDKMDDEITVRFRVGNVYKNYYLEVYIDDERVIRRKRPVVAPGEMENVVLKKEQLQNSVKTVKILIAEE